MYFFRFIEFSPKFLGFKPKRFVYLKNREFCCRTVKGNETQIVSPYEYF